LVSAYVHRYRYTSFFCTRFLVDVACVFSRRVRD